MSKIAEKIHNVALQKAEEYSKTHGHTIIEEVAYGRGYKTAYIECYDQAMQDFLEKAIIAYCEVCKMPNCVTQNQKEICPYLSKFRRCLKSLLNN